MLNEIGTVKAIPAFIEGVKRGEQRLMGFGHRVYKNYDPRAKVIKRLADTRCSTRSARARCIDIALELERIALQDEYFIERKLYPNVDFYSGIIYQAMGFPDRHVPGAVRDRRACRAGSRSGKRCSQDEEQRSRARARSTSAATSATTNRSANGSGPERNLNRQAAEDAKHQEFS